MPGLDSSQGWRQGSTGAQSAGMPDEQSWRWRPETVNDGNWGSTPGSWGWGNWGSTARNGVSAPLGGQSPVGCPLKKWKSTGLVCSVTARDTRSRTQMHCQTLYRRPAATNQLLHHRPPKTSILPPSVVAENCEARLPHNGKAMAQPLRQA